MWTSGLAWVLAPSGLTPRAGGFSYFIMAEKLDAQDRARFLQAPCHFHRGN